MTDTTQMTRPTDAADHRIEELLTEVGLADGAAGITARLVGADPVLPTPYPVGEAAATAIGAAATIAAQTWRDATGQGQEVTVDVRRAAESLVSFLRQRVDGPPMERPGTWSSTTHLFQANGGRWIHLHGGFPHLADGTLRVLDCPPDRGSIAAAVAERDPYELEEALAAAGMCGAVARTREEWLDHPQAQALAPLGRVVVRKIADGPAVPATDGERPYGEVRVLDLTRLLAGPTVGRTLAEHGADVLLVNSPNLDNIDPFVIDTSHGKRSTCLDLDDEQDADRLRALAAEADVFVQGYRGDSLAKRGFGPEALTKGHPGLVYVSVNCYGPVGPWRDRPGWEQLAQSACGLAIGHGGAETPDVMPAAVCDYTTGYLAAVGAAAALRRRALEGGSFTVEASLCQTAMWIGAMGPTLDPARVQGSVFGDEGTPLVTSATGFGTLQHLPPVAGLSATPARWDLPPSPIGTHPPTWW
jgi:crotonobetainyl-CoA:carnitine CoA-transferase CaiB-like acyl-CoA transferase